jgi:hypothetical protein
MKIVGITKKCLTKVTALSNIRKFLEVYRRIRGLPPIFFVTEEAIYERKEHLILYLLEELIRFIHNIPSSFGKSSIPFIIAEIPSNK